MRQEALCYSPHMLEVSAIQIIYLHDNPGSNFCHDCLTKLVRSKEMSFRDWLSLVAGMTFVESVGLCSECGKYTQVLGAQS